MMKNPEQTVGNLIDKQGVSFIASISGDGFPCMKAMLPPRKREGIKEFLVYHQYFFYEGFSVSGKRQCQHLFLRQTFFQGSYAAWYNGSIRRCRKQTVDMAGG